MKRPESFTHAYTGITNILLSKVSVAAYFDPETQRPQNHHKYLAIWDTGATQSAITSRVVQECGLIPIGRITVNTANGPRDANVYLINILLPHGVTVAGISATEADVAGDIDMLIGMDVIGMGDFAITNQNKKTTFSFRIPSSTTINFVKKDRGVRSKKRKKQPKKKGRR